MAGLLPMVAAVERSFRIDQDVGDVLDVAHFLVAAPHLQEWIVSRGRRVGRIEFEYAAEPRPETSRQRPVLSLDVMNDAASGPRQQRRDHQADAFTRSCRCKAQNVFRSVMAQIMPAMAAEDDTVRAEQSGRVDFLVGGPARRTIGLDVLCLARSQDRHGDGDRDGDESAGRRDKGALDEYRWRVGVVGIPPPEERRRIIDRHTLRQFEPGLPELRLKAEPPRRPLRRHPGGRQHDGQDQDDLTPENAGSRHNDSDRLVMRSRSENNPLGERQSKTIAIAPPDTMARKSAGLPTQDRARRACSTDCSSSRR